MPQFAATLVQQAPVPDAIQLCQRGDDREAHLLRGAVRIGLRATRRFGGELAGTAEADASAPARDERRPAFELALSAHRSDSSCARGPGGSAQLDGLTRRVSGNR